MKKILFTIQWYPSVLSANALCDQKIIDVLKSDQNYDITSLTYRSNDQSSYEEIDGVKVHRFVRSWWWNKVIDAKKGVNNHKSFILNANKVLLRLKQIITMPLYPYTTIKSCLKFSWQAYKLHKKEHFDVVVSEHHGLDSLCAGFFLKHIDPNIKFIGILWDPISAKESPKYLPKKYAQKRLVWQERHFLLKADCLIGMKSSKKTVESLGFPFDGNHKVGDIPGIIAPSYTDFRAKELNEKKINIVFSGILSLPDRDPEYIIKLINSLDNALDFNLIFYCTGAGREKLYHLQKEFKGSISICNYIPHEDLMSVYSQCDILLNFGGRNPNMVPSKIFEYMSFAKPIISLYSIDNEASKNYFERYPLAICIDERLPLLDNKEVFAKFVSSLDTQNLSFEDVANLFPENTPYAYKNIIDSISNVQ